MKRVLCLVGCTLIGCYVGAQVDTPPAPESDRPGLGEVAERTITVDLRCVDSAGDGVVGVPLRGFTLIEEWQVRTDQQGRAHATIRVGKEEPTLQFGMMGLNPELAPKDESSTDVMEWLEYNKKYAVPGRMCVRLTPEQDTYSKVIEFQRGRTIRLRLVEANGIPVQGIVSSTTGWMFEDMETEAPKVVTSIVGASANAPVTLLVWAGPEVFEILVPASDHDEDLGDVVVPAYPADAKATIVFDRSDAMDRRLPLDFGGITLVSTDGSRVLYWFAPKGKTRDFQRRKDGPVILPSGEYWVAPTQISLYGTSAALRNLVRAGIDLNGSGIPKLVIPPGGSAELRADAPTVQKAILDLAAAHGLDAPGQ